MSPEQARGQETDFRSDVYSMGILTFELFTGRAPFIGSTPVATLLQHVDAEPPFDQPSAAAIPLSLRPVLTRALEKDPGERFENAGSLRAALERSRQASLGEATTGQASRVAAMAASSQSLATASTMAERHAPAWRGLGVGALLLGIIAGGWIIHRWSVEPLPAANSSSPSDAAIRPQREGLPTSPAESEDEEAIRQVLGACAWAIRTRDVKALEKLKPSMSASELERLRRLLQQSSIRSMRVSMTIESIRVEGDHAMATLTRHDTINGHLAPQASVDQALEKRRLVAHRVDGLTRRGPGGGNRKHETPV